MKKKNTKVQLFLVRIAEVLHIQAPTQRTIDVFRAFMEYGLAKKITACANASREPNMQEVAFIFAWSGAAQNFELL